MKNHDSYDEDKSYENETRIGPVVKNDHCVTYWAMAAAKDTDALWAAFERDIQS